MLKFQAASNTKNLDVGANAFIGNLDPEIDEKMLYDTFSAFGVILQTPKVLSIWCSFSKSQKNCNCMVTFDLQFVQLNCILLIQLVKF